MSLTGILVKGYGSFYTVSTDEGYIEARARGRLKGTKQRLYIGDRVVLEKEQETYAIVDVLERKNSIIRPAVANIDQIVVVIAAASPDPNYKQTDKLLAFLEYSGLDVSICINKSDLENCDEIKQTYEKAGYKVIVTSSAKEQGIENLKELLKDKLTAFAGCSGVGKSSLINSINRQFMQKTGEVGKIERGRHTTTYASLLPLDFGGYIIDTPGFSVIDISNIEKQNLTNYFREFNEYSPMCRFNGCTHKNAADCKVIEMVEKGVISRNRYNSYLELFDELSQINRYK